MQNILKYDNIITHTNITAIIKDFVASRRIDYVYITSSLNKFILLNLPIAMNLFKCKKLLCSLSKDKNVPYSRFYKDEWFLDFGTSTYLTLFEFDFVDITLDNYGWVKTVNLKVLFMITFGIILIEYEIFDSKKETTKVTMSKL